MGQTGGTFVPKVNAPPGWIVARSPSGMAVPAAASSAARLPDPVPRIRAPGEAVQLGKRIQGPSTKRSWRAGHVGCPACSRRGRHVAGRVVVALGPLRRDRRPASKGELAGPGQVGIIRPAVAGAAFNVAQRTPRCTRENGCHGASAGGPFSGRPARTALAAGRFWGTAFGAVHRCSWSDGGGQPWEVSRRGLGWLTIGVGSANPWLPASAKEQTRRLATTLRETGKRTEPSGHGTGGT